ncbi:hypothetical protein GUITHDRAFT_145503 [Guillardia theta CCMP2712]|uniref:PDZ domain-containing protein n=1 Tax=Guillardia theta (strain CCMP2712) TaxID=905079 RepID=L1IKJ1_GUITC|nr:hypothetical protein GUITHDRAFT_145503 [Guillardia theta CCMP2712]EKX36761.1 hypothetical protein GUITHDRAFT_145503 [Guillardia theta CCMP2712]|eukprot:XP_005823741.1 hypothetical protein GUITHDRAFT_145503 [Guillardia theta CCMP2712]
MGNVLESGLEKRKESLRVCGNFCCEQETPPLNARLVRSPGAIVRVVESLPYMNVIIKVCGQPSSPNHTSPSQDASAGIGAMISMDPKSDRPTFTAIFCPNEHDLVSPCPKVGDVLLEIDGVSVRYSNVYNIASKMLGPAGTSVEILVSRGEENVPILMRRRLLNVKEIQNKVGGLSRQSIRPLDMTIIV